MKNWKAYASLPILWLYLGPPILRPPTGRSAMESIAGQFDAWNVMRLVWWAFVGLITVVAIYRNRHHVREYVRSMPQLVLWVLVFVSSLVVSSIYSPSQMFTFANAGMMVVLVVAAFDLGLRIHARTIELDTVLRGLYAFSMGLLAMIVISFVVDPDRVSKVQGFGLRVGGGNIGDASLLAAATFFLAAYFLMSARGAAAWWYRISMLASFVLLLSTQTRTAYIGLALGGAYLALQWVVIASPRARVAALGMVLILAGLAPPALLVADTVTGESTVARASQYLIREERSLATASGRTAISGLLLEQMASRPWGLGYSAGPRILLQTSYSELAEQGVRAEGIGNAHNKFLEVLGGSGVLGLFAYVAALVWVVLNMHRAAATGLLVVRSLFVYVMLAGLTSSNGVLPFFQASVLIWLLVGTVAGVNGLLHVLPDRAAMAKQRGRAVPVTLGEA